MKGRLKEQEDYYKINELCWLFVIKLFKGGPEVKQIRPDKPVVVTKCQHYYTSPKNEEDMYNKENFDQEIFKQLKTVQKY